MPRKAPSTLQPGCLAVMQIPSRITASAFPTVMAAKKAHQAELVETAYLKLWDAVERGDMWAVLFTLRTLGKDQGFSERYEVTGQAGGPIEHASIHLWEERLQAGASTHTSGKRG